VGLFGCCLFVCYVIAFVLGTLFVLFCDSNCWRLLMCLVVCFVVGFAGMLPGRVFVCGVWCIIVLVNLQ